MCGPRREENRRGPCLLPMKGGAGDDNDDDGDDDGDDNDDAPNGLTIGK